MILTRIKRADRPGSRSIGPENRWPFSIRAIVKAALRFNKEIMSPFFLSVLINLWPLFTSTRRKTRTLYFYFLNWIWYDSSCKFNRLRILVTTISSAQRSVYVYQSTSFREIGANINALIRVTRYHIMHTVNEFFFGVMTNIIRQNVKNNKKLIAITTL